MKRLYHSFLIFIFFFHYLTNHLSAQVEDEVIQKYLDSYLSSGDPAMVEKINKEAPDSRYDRFCLAYKLLDEDNEKGIMLSRKLVSNFPDFPEAYFALGTFMINDSKQYDSAIIYLDKAIALKPDFISALFNRGIGEVNLCIFEAAKSDFDKVIEFDSIHAGAYVMRAVSKFMLRDYKSMLSDMEIALRIDPYILSDFDFLQVRKTIDRAIALAPENTNLYAGRGFANYKSGYFRLGVKDFAMALKLDPGNSEYYKMMGVCMIYLNDITGAESNLIAAAGINPGDAEIYYFLGLHANDLLGQPGKSIEYISKAIELDAVNPLYYYQRALMSYNLYEYKTAVEDINKAIELDSLYGDYFSLRALSVLDGDLETDYDYCKDFRTAEKLGTSYEVEKYISRFCGE